MSAAAKKKQRPDKLQRVECDDMCVLYKTPGRTMTSTWMGDQSKNKSRGSRHYDPVKGKLNKRKGRNVLLCAVYACQKEVRYREDEATGRLEYKFASRKYHHCEGALKHRKLMRKWYEERLWTDVNIVTHMCIECNGPSRTARYGLRHNAPVVWLGRTYMALVCKLFHVVLIVRFDTSYPETVPTPPGYTIYRMYYLDDVPMIKTAAKPIDYGVLCTNCTKVVKFPLCVDTATCSVCNKSHGTAYIDKTHAVSTSSTSRQFEYNHKQHVFVYDIGGVPRLKLKSKSKSLDPNELVWLVPKPPMVQPKLLRGTLDLRPCDACIQAAADAEHARLELEQIGQSRDRETTEQTLLWTKHALLKGRSVDVADDDPVEIDAIEELNSLGWGFGSSHGSVVVTCYACFYSVPIKSAVHVIDLPSTQHFGGIDAPINPIDGFYFCAECIGECEYCGSMALVHNTSTLCTLCNNVDKHNRLGMAQTRPLGARVPETTSLGNYG